MVIFRFTDKTFLDIPRCENPAFIKKDDWKTSHLQCMVICKQIERKAPYLNAGRYCVLLITANNNPLEDETVEQVGLFWEIDDAELFANAYRKRLTSTWHGIKLRKGTWIRVNRLFGHIATSFQKTRGNKFFNVGHAYQLSEDYMGDKRLFLLGLNDVWWTEGESTVEFEPCVQLSSWDINMR